MNIIKIMTPKALTVFLHTGDTVRQGLELLRQHGYTAIPVLNDQGEYLGSITEGDFLRHILAVGTTDRKAHEKYRIGGLLRPDFCPPLGIRATPDQVAQALLRQNAPSWPSLWSGQIWRIWRHPRCNEKTSVPCGTEVFCQPYSNHTARVTLPERRHLVQTYTWVGVPFTIAFTRFTLGFQTRLERRWEWETWMPKVTPLSQNSHLAMLLTSSL